MNVVNLNAMAAVRSRQANVEAKVKKNADKIRK